MEFKKNDCIGLVEISREEMFVVKGGVAVAFLDNFWDYVQGAISFLKEYKEEIWNGLKRGWKNL